MNKCIYNMYTYVYIEHYTTIFEDIFFYNMQYITTALLRWRV